jgi:hypothetical protein
MIAITTKSSISVNPRRVGILFSSGEGIWRLEAVVDPGPGQGRDSWARGATARGAAIRRRSTSKRPARNAIL